MRKMTQFVRESPVASAIVTAAILAAAGGIVALKVGLADHASRISRIESDMRSTEDVIKLVKDHSPYNVDREFIRAAMNQQTSDLQKLTDALTDHSKEIHNLRLDIERMMVVKPVDVYRKLEEMEKKIADHRYLNAPSTPD